MTILQHRTLLIFTAVWVIVLPFVWARLLAWMIVCPYVVALPRFWPDLVIGGVTALLLPATWLRKSWAIPGLLGAAIVLPVLKVVAFYPTLGPWLVSMVLLILSAVGVRSAKEGPVPEAKRLALRWLLVPVYGLAALGTASAYLHFVVGTIAGVDGITKGRYFLGAVLSILCLLAVLALCRVWLIGARLWRFGAYTNASSRDRTWDAAGVASAAAALVGFIIIAKPIFRVEEVWLYGILLAPAALLSIIAFLWSVYVPRSSVPAGMNDGAGSAATLRLADLPGLICGTAFGLLGIYYLVPRPISGWGPCDWTVFYPLYPDLWPVERPMVFDACSNDAMTLGVVSIVLSLICVVAGGVAAAIGRNANAVRGAATSVVVVAAALTRLVVTVKSNRGAEYYGWVESFIVAVLIVAGAGWLGYLGGVRGVRWSRRRAS